MQNLNKEFEIVDRAKMEENVNRLQNIETIFPNFEKPNKTDLNTQLLDNIVVSNKKLRSIRDK